MHHRTRTSPAIRAGRLFPLLALALLFTIAGPTAADDGAPLPPELLAPEKVAAISSADFKRVLEHHKGKVVVVNFWATWCIPCIQELPEFNLLQTRYAEKGVVVLAVSVDEPDLLEKRVQPFFAEKAPDLTSYLSTEDSSDFIGAFEPEWLGALPTTIFFGRDGKIDEVVNGRLLYHALEEKVIALSK